MPSTHFKLFLGDFNWISSRKWNFIYTYLYTYELKGKEVGEGLCHAVQTYNTTSTSIWIGRRALNTLIYPLSQLFVCTHTPKTPHRFLDFTCRESVGEEPLGSQELEGRMLLPRVLSSGRCTISAA